MWRKLALAAAVLGGVLFAWGPIVLAPAGLPIERLRDEAARGTVPYLFGPLPAWLPLPASGHVMTASTTAPQPPFGASVSLLLGVDVDSAAFADAYSALLAAAGYQVRRLPPPFDFSFTGEFALDAFDARTGRYVVCVLRRAGTARSAQITFWEAPAPRL